jgi:hypothetical protein
MNNQESLLTELKIKMDAIISKYEVAFKQSQKRPEEFENESSETIRGELARVATDTVHDSILAGLSYNENFIQSVELMSVESFNELKKEFINCKTGNKFVTIFVP